MHNWTVVQIGGDLQAPTPVQQQPQNKREAGEQMQQSEYPVQQRGQSWNIGTAKVNSGPEIYETLDDWWVAVEYTAAFVLPRIGKEPVYPSPDAPQEPSSSVAKPEGTETPGTGDAIPPDRQTSPKFNVDGTEIEVRVFANRGEFMQAAWDDFKFNGGRVMNLLAEPKWDNGKPRFPLADGSIISHIQHIDHTDPAQWQYLVNVFMESGSV